MNKPVTHIEVWKDTRDKLKAMAKEEGVSMKKLIDTWVQRRSK